MYASMRAHTICCLLVPTESWNSDCSFGWSPGEDGLRRKEVKPSCAVSVPSSSLTIRGIRIRGSESHCVVGALRHAPEYAATVAHLNIDATINRPPDRCPIPFLPETSEREAHLR